MIKIDFVFSIPLPPLKKNTPHFKSVFEWDFVSEDVYRKQIS